MNNQVLIKDRSGQSIVNGRIDGLAKANETALYTDDIKLPEMVYGKVVRSPYQ